MEKGFFVSSCPEKLQSDRGELKCDYNAHDLYEKFSFNRTGGN